MSAPHLEFLDTKIIEKTYDGQVSRRQAVVVHSGRRFGMPAQIKLEAGQRAFTPGKYEIAPASFKIGEFREIQVGQVSVGALLAAGSDPKGPVVAFEAGDDIVEYEKNGTPGRLQQAYLVIDDNTALPFMIRLDVGADPYAPGRYFVDGRSFSAGKFGALQIVRFIVGDRADKAPAGSMQRPAATVSANA